MSQGPGSTQPPGSAQYAGPKPENYLIQSILVTICCCIPLGIVAIVFSAQVDSKWNAGDYSGAIEASENAKKWGWIGFAVGITVNVIVIILQILLNVWMNV